MIKNVLIAGVGGQGVNALSIVIQNACLNEGLYCKSSIFKGGAQKRGAIYSFIRIFENKSDTVINFSGEIGGGELDVMISLEYIESLRYIKYYNRNTKLLINQNEVTFFSKRYSNELGKINPTEILNANYNNVRIEDYSIQSKDFFGKEKMLNFVMGFEAVKTRLLPIGKGTFIDEFLKKNIVTENIQIKMKEYVDEGNK